MSSRFTDRTQKPSTREGAGFWPTSASGGEITVFQTQAAAGSVTVSTTKCHVPFTVELTA